MVIGIGGMLGAISRYLLMTYSVELNIFVINFLACFILGITSNKINNQKYINFINIGFLGSFSSMSAVIILININHYLLLIILTTIISYYLFKLGRLI